VRRKVEMDDLLHALDDADVLALARRVTPHHDDRFSIENRVGPSLVEVDLKGGGTRRKQLDIVYGGPGNTMSWDDIARKFRSCVAHSAKPPSAAAVERLVEQVARLEDVEDAGEIARALA
jgi:2-methylcitrate dehydratase PrpD